MNEMIDLLEKEHMRLDLPKVDVGDTIRVHTKIHEGDKERIQVFEGVVIGQRGGNTRATFTVRKVSYGVGVEKTFPVHSPLIETIELLSKAKVRRAKLYYLRGLKERRQSSKRNELKMNCLLSGIVAGLDEAGRGPLAGPVVASCVAWQGLPAERAPVNDSKLLSEQQRKRFSAWILSSAFRIGVGLATPREIEKLNIHNATLLSMKRAIKATGTSIDLILVDGLFAVQPYKKCRTLVKGDRKCFFIACASIVAKVARDEMMEKYDDLYPQYLFKKHKGYATQEHREAIRVHGLLIHRRTFWGVKELVFEDMDEGRLL